MGAVAAPGVARITDRGGQVYNVKASGAKGDGTTDDRAAIQAAIDLANAAGGGTVFFPGGIGTIYGVAGDGSGGLAMKSNVRLLGYGAKVKLLSASAASTRLLSGSSLSDIELTGLTFDGGSTAYNEANRDHVIYLPGATRATVRDCRIQSSVFDALNIYGTDIVIEDNFIQLAGRDGINVPGTSTRLLITGNTVINHGRRSSGNDGYGILVQAVSANTDTGSEISIVRNVVDNPASAGNCAGNIYVAGNSTGSNTTNSALNVVIADNVCRRAGNGNASYQGAAIVATHMTPGVVIANNSVRSSAYVGISTGTAGDVVGAIIRGNSSIANTQSGIEVNATNNLIEGNYCADNGGHGIYASGRAPSSVYTADTGYHLVKGNVCARNTNNGITIGVAPGTVVEGNLCFDNASAGGAFSGIAFTTSAANLNVQHCFLNGNRCYDTRAGGSRTQRYGIDTSGDNGSGSKLDGSVIRNNLLYNNLTGALALNATQTAADSVGGNHTTPGDPQKLIERANGQALSIKTLSELTTIAAAATTDTTIQMPAGAIILGVSVRTTVVIPTATSYSVGDSGSATRFNTANVGVAANSTDAGTKAGAYYNAGALAVRLTMNGGTPANNTGRVRVTIHYLDITPPTS